MAQRTSTAKHFQATVTVNGKSYGKFDLFEGGDNTSESTKHASSSFVGRRAALGSPAELSDVTVGRFFQYDRDHDVARELDPLVGLGEMAVSKQPLDANGSPFGRPRVYTGVLQGVMYPEFNVDSNDLSMLRLMMTCDGTVG